MGVVLGLPGYMALRHGIARYFSTTDNTYLTGLGKLASAGTYAPMGWILLIWILLRLLDRSCRLFHWARMSPGTAR